MGTRTNLSIPLDELTGNISLDGDHSAVDRSGNMSTGRKIREFFRRHDPRPVLVLAGILGCSVLAGFLVRSLLHLTGFSQTGFGQFLISNTFTIVVGFGAAAYGCSVNRSLHRRLQQHEQLGPYTLHELIGSGGMGDVYLAEHQLLKRKCAVKLIRRDKASNRRMLARFEREVKATAQLTHWNTVQVYDYGCTASGTFYYAMEYLEGLNLRQLVIEHGPLPPGRVVFILRQLCGALHEATQFGLVHRDIKPSNIFLAERGHVYDVAKLLDFGLVRPATIGTCPIRNVSRQLQGSPRFMCPEQAQGLKPDFRGDLYSLACVAYYLLAGRAPFEDDNPVMLVVAHASIPAPRFDEIGVDVPADLAAVVMKCLNKRPEDRYQSPRELQDALERCRCAWEWTWKDAERWWLDHPDETHHQAGEQTNLAIDTHRIEPATPTPVAEPDATIVCEDRSGFDHPF